MSKIYAQSLILWDSLLSIGQGIKKQLPNERYLLDFIAVFGAPGTIISGILPSTLRAIIAFGANVRQRSCAARRTTFSSFLRKSK